jgi:hypothetical protein
VVFPLTKKAPRGTLPDWDRWPSAPGHLPLISVDPGEGTGIVVLSVPSREIFSDAEYSGVNVIWYEEIIGTENNQADLIIGLAMYLLFNIGIRRVPLLLEDFSLRKFTRDPALLAPVRLNAKIEYGLHRELSIPAISVPVFKQPAELAMSTITDDRLKQYDLYAVGQKNARMAMAHALTFLRRARERPAIRKKAWGE